MGMKMLARGAAQYIANDVRPRVWSHLLSGGLRCLVAFGIFGCNPPPNTDAWSGNFAFDDAPQNSVALHLEESVDSANGVLLLDGGHGPIPFFLAGTRTRDGFQLDVLDPCELEEEAVGFLHVRNIDSTTGGRPIELVWFLEPRWEAQLDLFPGLDALLGVPSAVANNFNRTARGDFTWWCGT